MEYALRFPLEDEGRTPARIQFVVERVNPVTASLSPGQPNADPDAESADANSTPAVEVTGQLNTERQGSISLFLPPEISFQDGVAFDEVSFNSAAGRTALGVLEGGGGTFSLSGIAEDLITSGIDAITSAFTNSETRRALITRIAQNSGDEEVAGIASLASQTSINPNKRVLFKSVNLRTFQFSFTMIPASAQEAEAVKAIVKRFRTELYPEEINATVGATTIPFGYKFPNRFLISFTHAGRGIATKLKPAYLDNVTTSYNSGGTGFFPDGNFTETTISLSFKEYKTLSKRDIGEGF